MKTILQSTTLVIALMITTSLSKLNAQTVSSLEGLTLAIDSYWDGSSNPLGTTFTDGNAIYPNYYDTSWGGFWSSGWAYSNVKDSVTAGYGNLFAARTATGYNSSSNYAVGQQNAKIILSGNAAGKVVHGFYITNSTYTAISMRDGDMFAKQFGGPSGNDPDWFKVTIRKWQGGIMAIDSVEFYLADFRFTDNSQDYILTSWAWVDLSGLGNVDSLLFELSSSDVGGFGMNTPAFFCIDNFTTADSPVLVESLPNTNNLIEVYPNPVQEKTIIDLSLLNDEFVLMSIFDLKSQLMYAEWVSTKNKISFDWSAFQNGIYLINIQGEKNKIVQKIIKA